MRTCPPQVAEIGYSARNSHDHDRIRRNLDVFAKCPADPTPADVLRLQALLWKAGLGRAVGAVDLVIAAYGIANSVTVVHYDSDFEHVAKVEPEFRHRWIVPRGSL